MKFETFHAYAGVQTYNQHPADIKDLANDIKTLKKH
jgi:hypothetical protein